MVSWNCKFQPLRGITDYLSAWMCFWKQYLTSYNREYEWSYKNKNMQNKNLWFCPTTKDNKVKLLLTTQKNQSFCYHVLMWKTNWFSRSTHRIYSKKIQTKQNKTKQNCSKSCSQFRIPQTNTYVLISRHFRRKASAYFCLLQAIRLSNKTYSNAIL